MQGGLLNPWVSQTESRLSVVLLGQEASRGGLALASVWGSRVFYTPFISATGSSFVSPCLYSCLSSNRGPPRPKPPFSKMLLLQPLLISPSIHLFVVFLH